LSLGIMHSDSFWPSFCHAIEREDLKNDSRFASFESREKNHATLFRILEEVFLSKTLAEWTAILDDTGLASTPVQNLSEVITDPQARANEYFVPFEHPTYGHIEVVANPVNLSKTKETIRRPSPELGQHTEEILLEHGYSQEDIARFKKQNIIAS
ncbi:CoA transferase, partial [Chloroflexota bacterium]